MRKFIFRVLIILVPAYIVVLYYYFLILPNLTGDLGNLGQIPFGNEYEFKISRDYLSTSKVDEFTNVKTDKKYSLITIGDSFSQFKLTGYQNFIKTKCNYDVLNIPKNELTPEQNALILLNNGFFDKNKTNIVIVESVERYFIQRLIDIDFNKNATFNLKSDKDQNAEEVASSSTNSLLPRLTSWIRLKFDYQNPVKSLKLKQQMFSDKRYGENLYFYEQDILLEKQTIKNIELAKTNLLKLNSIFKKHNVKLIYMIAADKYDVYEKYTNNNSFPVCHLLEYFDSIDKNCCVINTKIIFEPLLDAGEKDIYKMNDSHWSVTGHKIVANILTKEIQNYIDNSALKLFN